MSEVGLEPTRNFLHKHLKLACLPIPTHGHKGGSRVLSAPKESEMVNPYWARVLKGVYSKLRADNFTTCQLSRKEAGKYDKTRHGLSNRNRTHDILLPKQALYQTELYPDIREKNDKDFYLAHKVGLNPLPNV